MSQGISIKRGANINLIGEAEKLLSEAQPSKTFALKPDNFFSLVPRLMVKVGESVAKGTILHLLLLQLCLLNPLSGTIKLCRNF